MGEFIYTMKNVRKAIGDKVILDNVTMAFYPGAKIGVVGSRKEWGMVFFPSLSTAVHTVVALSIPGI